MEFNVSIRPELLIMLAGLCLISFAFFIPTGWSVFLAIIGTLCILVGIVCYAELSKALSSRIEKGEDIEGEL